MRSTPHRLPGTLLVAAAVLSAVAGCGAPSPSPSPTASPAVVPTPVRAANATPSPTASPVRSTSDPAAPVVATFEVPLHNAGGRPVLDLTVNDRSGHLLAATPGDEHGMMPEPADPDALAIGAGRTGDAIRVQIAASICDRAATLDIAADGRTLSVAIAPREACDAQASATLVELQFDGPVSAGDFTGRQARSPFTSGLDLADVHPTAVAFADSSHGWVGATTEDGRAAILETTDGGATWTVSLQGDGSVATIVPAPGGAIAGTRCAPGVAECGAGTWAEFDGGWFATGRDHLVSASVDGEAAIGLFEVAGATGDTGMPVSVLRTTDDGGLAWTDGTIPCVAMDAASVAILTGGRRLVLCAGQGAGGGSLKALFASDAGAAWSQLASTGAGGGLPSMGAPVHMTIAPDGTGLLWGPRVQVMGTTDAGRTWSDLGLTDGDSEGSVRVGADGRSIDGGLAAMLVADERRQAAVVDLTTDGGQSWKELASWSMAPWWWK